MNRRGICEVSNRSPRVQNGKLENTRGDRRPKPGNKLNALEQGSYRGLLQGLPVQLRQRVCLPAPQYRRAGRRLAALLQEDKMRRFFPAAPICILALTKDVWNRPRPFAVSTEVHAIGELSTSGSYPSGHATRGQLTAIILANMVPEKSAQIYARGREYGENRIIAGVHFPSDIEGGRLSATAIAAVLMQNDQFKMDFNEAKAELRNVLGLAP